MRRITMLSLLFVTLGSGAALADRADHRSSAGRSAPQARAQVRDHRATPRVDRRVDRRVERRTERRVERRADRWEARRASPVRTYRTPVYARGGYFQFNTGARYRYTRPAIARRYFDFRVRPQLIVESYQPVPGYVWIQGDWQWNGYEWIWVAGHYEVDPAYAYPAY